MSYQPSAIKIYSGIMSHPRVDEYQCSHFIRESCWLTMKLASWGNNMRCFDTALTRVGNHIERWKIPTFGMSGLKILAKSPLSSSSSDQILILDFGRKTYGMLFMIFETPENLRSARAFRVMITVWYVSQKLHITSICEPFLSRGQGRESINGISKYTHSIRYILTP